MLALHAWRLRGKLGGRTSKETWQKNGRGAVWVNDLEQLRGKVSALYSEQTFY